MDRERGSLCPCGSHPRAGVPIGDGPAPIVGVGQRGVRPEPSGPGRRPRRHRPLLGVALAAVLASGLPVGPGPTIAAAVPAPATGGAPITLVSQTPWVVP